MSATQPEYLTPDEKVDRLLVQMLDLQQKTEIVASGVVAKIQKMEKDLAVRDEIIAKAVMANIADEVVKRAVTAIQADWEKGFLPALQANVTNEIRELADQIQELRDLAPS